MAAKNEDGLTLAQWMRKVDAVLLRRCGMDTGDLADQCFWDAWNDCVTPEEMAQTCLDYEGFSDA